MGEREDLVEKLAAAPDRVAKLIEGLSEEALRRRPAEGEWSMKEVCGHLVEDARTWQERVTLVTTQADAYLKRYDPEAGVREGGYQEAPIEETMDEFRRVRGQTIELLSGLSAEGWERTGRHWSEGEMTVAKACEIALEHAEMHLEQLRETRDKVTS
ncbi:MAG TPA: DinB family protein [Dehalococcoidia bacterium]|nr:DinB family protein [Dehalococcoidia bacterium]